MQTTYNGALDERAAHFLKICAKHNPIAIATNDKKTNTVIRWMLGWTTQMDSGIQKSSSIDEVCAKHDPGPRAVVHVVFTNKQELVNAVQEVKQADLGLSVVISGIFEDVFKVCEQVETGPHTVNLSLGTWGKTEQLPLEPILSLVTMCGHSMISRHLINHLIERVKEGEMTPEQAAIEMGKQCTCNIFNVERGAQILRDHLKLP